MNDTRELRTAYKVTEDGLIPVEFKEIKEGDKICLMEPDGQYVRDGEGQHEWVTQSDAYYSEELNEWVIKI